MKFGIKEVLNVVFIDKKTNKPALYFDTLKVSNIENASENATATGGQGNSTLITWSYGRTATLTITDALLSMQSLAALAGSDVTTEAQKIYNREVFNGVTDTITLAQTPVDGTLTVFKVVDGEMAEEVVGAVAAEKVVTLTPALAEKTDVAVYYEYELEAEKSQTVEFSGNKFPSAYKVYGFGVVRNQDGQDETVQLQIPTAQLKTDSTITLDAENVSTFDFNLDITASGEDKTLYKIVKF